MEFNKKKTMISDTNSYINLAISKNITSLPYSSNQFKMGQDGIYAYNLLFFLTLYSVTKKRNPNYLANC